MNILKIHISVKIEEFQPHHKVASKAHTHLNKSCVFPLHHLKLIS